jgi:hypothetical protein
VEHYPLPAGLEQRRIASGGYGTVFEDPQDGQRLIKQFHRPLDGEDASQLALLLEAHERMRPSDRATVETRFCWPTKLYADARGIVGIQIPRAPSDAYFALDVAGGSQRRLLDLTYIIDTAYFQGDAVRSAPPELSDPDRAQLAIDIIDAVTSLHHNELVHGDISAKNICGRLRSPSRTFILDADSISTPEYRAARPIITPDHHAPEELDPIARDRSLVATIAWRLLQHRPYSYPVDDDERGVPVPVHRLLRNTYLHGGEASLVELRQLLAAMRDEACEQAAVAEARESRFARVILRDLPFRGSAKARSERERLEKRVALEDEASVASGLRLARILSELDHINDGLDADMIPSLPVPLELQERARLRSLIHEARFTDAARALAEGSFQTSLRDDAWAERAVQHALLDVEPAETRAFTTGDEVSVAWRWPTVPFVNSARLMMSFDGAPVLDRSVPRLDADRAQISVTAPHETEVTATIAFGVASPSQPTELIGTGHRSAPVSVRTPAAPKPVATASVGMSPSGRLALPIPAGAGETAPSPVPSVSSLPATPSRATDGFFVRGGGHTGHARPTQPPGAAFTRGRRGRRWKHAFAALAAATALVAGVWLFLSSQLTSETGDAELPAARTTEVP